MRKGVPDSISCLCLLRAQCTRLGCWVPLWSRTPLCHKHRGGLLTPAACPRKAAAAPSHVDLTVECRLTGLRPWTPGGKPQPAAKASPRSACCPICAHIPGVKPDILLVGRRPRPREGLQAVEISPPASKFRDFLPLDSAWRTAGHASRQGGEACFCQGHLDVRNSTRGPYKDITLQISPLCVVQHLMNSPRMPRPGLLWPAG